MTNSVSARKPVVDWMTVVAIAAIAISVEVAFHEGLHAVTCWATGGVLHEFSAQYVDCTSQTVVMGKIVSGIAPIVNIIVGLLIWNYLRKPRQIAPELHFFIWLFMLMNLLGGSGYFMFSGIANVGDMAAVIEGWEPAWLWRVMLTIVGTAMFTFFIWLALRLMGNMIGGEADEQIGRANKLSLLSYFTAILVAIIASIFNPLGLISLPTVTAVIAAAGSLSPLAWMMQWFRAKSFVKAEKQPLEIHRSWRIIAIAGVTVFVYAFVLGQTIYF